MGFSLGNGLEILEGCFGDGGIGNVLDVVGNDVLREWGCLGGRVVGEVLVKGDEGIGGRGVGYVGGVEEGDERVGGRWLRVGGGRESGNVR